MNKPYKNSGLFSDHYLSDRLPNFDVWQVDSSELVKVHEKIKTLYQTKKGELPNLSESALEERFIRPILRTLGHVYEVQPTLTSTAEGMKKPDYAFFENEEARTEAQKVSGKEEFFKSSLAVGEAKQWGRPLDKKLKTAKDPFEIQNPSLQMSRYLWLTGVKWGVLTDGCFWRLYERETSKRIDIYYEVDLSALLEQGTLEDFKYFYTFFNKDAFVRGSDEICLLDEIYEGSVDYREKVSDELKANVYQALRILAEGFLKNPANNLSPDSLQEIHDSSLVSLYRLLFVLYAEYRNLLPMDNLIYRDSYSLYALKREIAEKIDTKAALSQTMSHYHGKLKELFEVINVGNEELAVPPYNGGLFDPEKHEFLEEYRVGDVYLAHVIDLLSRSSDKAFVDYSSLEIRHLGSIYEGLLEYKLEIADEDMVAIKEKGKEKWVQATEVKESVRIFDEAKKGEIYLTTDKGERKATGSYYTPDYIVKYIVENTIGPLINEKKKLVEQKVKEIEEKVKSSRGYNREQQEKQLHDAENSLIDEILSLKVLDPAIGSGHFLVEATNYIARALVAVLSGEVSPEEKVVSEVKETAPTYNVETMEEEDICWARREVIERCIFGVDLNPLAVELAKLSLWLSTVAKDKPLSFLDHHLRCGNSLIGVKVDDLASLPQVSKEKKKAKVAPAQASLFEPVFKEKVNLMLKSFALLEELPYDTVDEIRKKEEYYQEFRKHVQRFKDIADVWTSTYFGNEVSYDSYMNLQMSLRVSNEEWEGLRRQTWFRDAVRIADEKRFFHWELEFPEIFFEGHQRKENSGFDAVIGNPPYVRATELSTSAVEHRQILPQLGLYKLLYKKWDIFIAFIERGIYLLRNGGQISLIVSEGINREEYAAKLRARVVDKLHIRRLDFFPGLELFPGVGIFNTIFLFKNSQPQEGYELERRIHLDQSLKNYVLEKLVHPFSPEIAFNPQSVKQVEVGVKTPIWLDQVFYISVGMVLNANEKICPGAFVKNDLVSLVDDNVPRRKFVESENISRFTILGHKYLEYGTARVPRKIRRPTFPELYKEERIFMSRGGEAQLVSGNVLTDQRVIIFKPWHTLSAIGNRSVQNERNTVLVKYGWDAEWLEEFSKQFNIKFFLAVLNSSVLVRIIRRLYQRDQFDITPDAFRKVPIPCISFTTPKVERESLVESLKARYQNSRFDELLMAIGECLPKDEKGNFVTEKEKSDVLHDFLAYLAEQMIEMNKEKQVEIKGFLEWLEREIGAGIDDLTNKTKIKAYHKHSFDDLLGVLKQNHNKLNVNLSSRDFQRNLETEFKKSSAQLEPLKDRIEKTDWLIDQIVYKLYGLTDEEIKIVEETTR